jgi:hypothetical protein
MVLCLLKESSGKRETGNRDGLGRFSRTVRRTKMPFPSLKQMPAGGNRKVPVHWGGCTGGMSFAVLSPNPGTFQMGNQKVLK